jgi:hypothetical protein
MISLCAWTVKYTICLDFTNLELHTPNVCGLFMQHKNTMPLAADFTHHKWCQVRDFATSNLQYETVLLHNQFLIYF